MATAEQLKAAADALHAAGLSAAAAASASTSAVAAMLAREAELRALLFPPPVVVQPPTPPVRPPQPPNVPPDEPFSAVVDGVVQAAFAANHYQLLFPSGTTAADGADLGGKRYSSGPKDKLRLGFALPPEWDQFEDPATLMISAPAGGVEPTGYAALGICGTRASHFDRVPVVSGGVYFHTRTDRGNSGPDLRDMLRKGHLFTQSGPRGVGAATAYCTWHGHSSWAADADGNTLVGVRSTNPMVPIAIGITMDGRMCRLTKQGGVFYEGQMPLDETPRAGSVYYDFAFYTPERKVHFAADWGLGRIIKAVHTPKVPQTFATEVFAEGFGQPSSLRAIDTVLYIVDASTGNIWALDVPTKVRRLVCNIPHAWWVDYDSQGRLVIMTLDRWIHTIDPATGQAVRPAWSHIFPVDTKVREWVQLCVDRNGSVGLKDAVLSCSSSGYGNVDVYRHTADGVKLKLHMWPGRCAVGPTTRITEPSHYPWAVFIMPDEGLMGFHGFAEFNPTIFVVDRGRKWASWTQEWEDMAQWAWRDGGSPAQRGKVTSFSAQCNVTGWALGGLPTFDVLAKMPAQELANWLKAGGVGSMPRDIPLPYLRAMVRWVRYQSIEHVRHATAGDAEAWCNEANAVT